MGGTPNRASRCLCARSRLLRTDWYTQFRTPAEGQVVLIAPWKGPKGPYIVRSNDITGRHHDDTSTTPIPASRRGRSRAPDPPEHRTGASLSGKADHDDRPGQCGRTDRHY